MENQNKEPKQVIIMRTDLRNQKGEKIRTGKLIAQGAHASLGIILDMMSNIPVEREMREFGGDYVLKGKKIQFKENGYLDRWINGLFTKICLQCSSESELELLYYKAKDAGLNCKLIIDAGLTEFGGVPTKTCIAIGPNNADKIDEITGHLKLL
jgi:PTH2 family peptidyl-tRNA hydrolase